MINRGGKDLGDELNSQGNQKQTEIDILPVEVPHYRRRHGMNGNVICIIRLHCVSLR